MFTCKMPCKMEMMMMDIHREQFQSTEGNREHYPFSSSGTELFAYNSRKDLLQMATYSAPIRTL